jgi:hypothetical protein
MPLVTGQQFQSPSVLESVQRGLQNRGMIQQQDIISQEMANQQRLRELSESQLATRQRALGVPSEVPTDETQQQAINRAIADNPDIAKQILDNVGIVSQRQKEDAATFASSVLRAPDEETVQFLIDDRIRNVTALGGDPSETMLLKDLDPKMRTAALQNLETAALTSLQREQFKLSREQLAARAKEVGTGEDPVQSSKILDDGTVQFLRRSGKVEVKTPEAATKDLIKEAQRFGAELQGLRSGERKAAEESIKQSIDAFKKLAPIKKNIKNLNEGIRLIDEGAQTGVIAKRFPSIKSASVQLDNLQGRLGLDIIADVTFGALSESELAFAKDTALPIGLEGEPLKEWLTRKRDSQKVLAESLEEAALFLGDPGNNVPDYIRLKRGQQTQPTEQQPQPPTEALPQGVTEDDITTTMRIHNMTRQQVLNRLRGQ